MKILKHYKNPYVEQSTLPIILIVLFVLLSEKNFLLFHSIVEIFAVIISFSLALIALGTVKISEGSYFTYIGISYGFVGVINIFHILTYKGINLLASDPNISTQLWIFQRYFEVASLLISFYFIDKKVNYKRLIAIDTIIVSFFIKIILNTDIFPECYIDGQGLTVFKIYSEYIICILFAYIIYLYYKDGGKHIKYNYVFLIYSMVFKIAGEYIFTLYIGVYDSLNTTAHLLNFISFCFLYKALFKSTITDPFSTVFKNLRDKAEELEKSNEEILKAKEKLEAEYERYKKVLNFLPEGIIIVKDEKIVYCNCKMLELIGLNPTDNLIDKSIYSIVEQEFHESLKLILNNDEELKDKSLEYKLKLMHKSCDVEISYLYMDDKEMSYYVFAVRDITDRKKAEEMRNIIAQKKKEEELNNEFFSNVSHELKTPINVIYTALQLENRYIDTLGTENIKKYNKIIKQNCLRLIKLVNNLIDITKIESGFFQPKLKVKNIVSIIEDITLSIVSYAQYKNINIIFDTDSEEVYVKCDEDLMERIMLNLLSNAVKYGKQGGVINIRIYNPKENFVTISIKDDGIGIPENMISKVFERFEKVDSSLSRNNEGSGIGLSIVKSLVEIQNGNIAIKSKVNEGTEFLLTFHEEEDKDITIMVNMERYTYEKNMIEKADIEFSDIYA
ncbi:PAS domain S-box-containing protein [Clostridium amylolyticum]|uniref:histidine kinase n=1 Tax=Clostridium amylolyticum TaxID=1121298 RepID=A0A1M6PK56_9CLOT|nr:MASE3 domain-containing protein [Clostridium amylolyticum]SHK08298.1 PAS domain S-box-containing protein [Clostridium amylolyticum]